MAGNRATVAPSARLAGWARTERRCPAYPVKNLRPVCVPDRWADRPWPECHVGSYCSSIVRVTAAPLRTISRLKQPAIFVDPWFPKTCRHSSLWAVKWQLLINSQLRRLANDRSSCLMVDADDSKSGFFAQIVDAVWGDWPAPDNRAGTQPLFRSLEVPLRQPTDDISDVGVQSHCRGRVSARQKLHGSQQISLGLRSEDDLQRRKLSSMRRNTAVASTPRP